MDYRTPPKTRPDFLVKCDERQRRLGWGYCKVCETLIPKADGTPHKGRSICSKKCKRQYFLAWAVPSGWITSFDLWELLGKRCKRCGDPADEIDHIKALCLLTESERMDNKWWDLDNLQPLCHHCHCLKTRDDIAKRKAMKKTQSQDGLFHRGLKVVA